MSLRQGTARLPPTQHGSHCHQAVSSPTNASCVVLLRIIKIICDQILLIIKMSKSKRKHSVFNENLKLHNNWKKGKNVNLPDNKEQENKRFKIWRENEQINVFCILTEFFHQPEKLESHAKFLF